MDVVVQPVGSSNMTIAVDLLEFREYGHLMRNIVQRFDYLEGVVVHCTNDTYWYSPNKTMSAHEPLIRVRRDAVFEWVVFS